MKEIILTSAYIKSAEDAEMLEKALQAMQATGKDILLTSHATVSEKIMKMVKYFIYDSVNELLPSERAPKLWFGNPSGLVYLYPTVGHGLVCMRNVYNGLKFAKSLGYEMFYIVDGDTLFSKEDLDIFDSCKHDLLSSGKKAWFFYEPPDFYDLRFFAGDIDFFLNSITFAITLEDWYKTPPYSSIQGPVLEILFYIMLEHHRDSVFSVTDSKLVSRCKTSKINESWMFEPAYVAYNINDANSPILFILGNSTSETEFKVYLDGELHLTVNYGPNVFGFIPIPKIPSKIKVESTNLVSKKLSVHEFDVTKDSLEVYKNYATFQNQ